MQQAGPLPFLRSLKEMENENTFDVLIPLKSNSLFSFRKIIMYLIIDWAASYMRIYHFHSIQKDSLVQQFLGGKCLYHSLLGKNSIYKCVV